MSMVWRLLCSALVLSSLVVGTFVPHARAEAATTGAFSACDGAGMPTNAVVRYYLALDRQQFAAAYACLSPAQQARWPYASWVAGYARTLRTRLLLADSEVPNGDPVPSVFVRIYALDTIHNATVGRIFSGHWRVDARGRLAAVALRQESGTPNVRQSAILTKDGRALLIHRRSDVDGDGRPDDIWITSGAGCGSCHAQQFWVYSNGRLIFEQQVDDAIYIVGRNHSGFELDTDTPNTPDLDSACPSHKTHEVWGNTAYGFTLRSSKVVKQKCLQSKRTGEVFWATTGLS